MSKGPDTLSLPKNVAEYLALHGMSGDALHDLVAAKDVYDYANKHILEHVYDDFEGDIAEFCNMVECKGPHHYLEDYVAGNAFVGVTLCMFTKWLDLAWPHRASGVPSE